MSKTYLSLNDDVGLAPAFIVDPKTGLDIPNPKAGEPESLTNIGVQIPVPTMVGDDVVDITHRVEIKAGERLDKDLRARIIPDSRVVETEHPAVANLLLETGNYHEVDPPASEQSRKPKSEDKE